MGVDTQKHWPIDTLLLAVLADGLTDGKGMSFVEAHFERGTAMLRGAECNPLLRHGGVRHVAIVGRDESGYIDQHRRLGKLSRQWTYFHLPASVFLGIPGKTEKS